MTERLLSEPPGDRPVRGTISTTPAPWAPVAQVREVRDATVTEVQDTPPTLTVEPLTNPVPVMVSTVLPAMEPTVGLAEIIVGAAT